MARKAIHAAGGIVVRSGSARTLIAVVQRSKDDRWVLPRGKLKRDEDPRAGARREAVEETGHRVEVKDYLGAITYTVRGQPKVVQFWRMRAAAQPSHDPARDIAAVEWLPLSAAVRRLSFVLEKIFLTSVGRRVLRRKHRTRGRSKHAKRRSAKHIAKRATKHVTKRAAKRTTRRPAKSTTGVGAHKPRHKASHNRAARVTSSQTIQPARGSLLRRMFSRLGR